MDINIQSRQGYQQKETIKKYIDDYVTVIESDFNWLKNQIDFQNKISNEDLNKVLNEINLNFKLLYEQVFDKEGKVKMDVEDVNYLTWFTFIYYISQLKKKIKDLNEYLNNEERYKPDEIFNLRELEQIRKIIDRGEYVHE